MKKTNVRIVVQAQDESGSEFAKRLELISSDLREEFKSNIEGDIFISLSSAADGRNTALIQFLTVLPDDIKIEPIFMKGTGGHFGFASLLYTCKCGNNFYLPPSGYPTGFAASPGGSHNPLTGESYEPKEFLNFLKATKTFDYLILGIENEYPLLKERLLELGAKGWELVGIDKPRYFFKREIYDNK